MPGYSWDPYSGVLLPKCCDDACSYAYDPGSGEQFVAECDPTILPGYVPNPGQCVCSDVVPPPLPPPPTGLFADPGVDTNTLLWSPNGLGDAFNVYRSTTPGGPYTFLADAGGGFTAFYVDSTAVGGTTYYYVVTKVVDGVESLPTNEADAATQTEWDGVVQQLLQWNPDLIISAEGLPGVLGTPIVSIVNRGIAGGTMGQTNAARQPTLVPAGLNGHPTMRFDGVDDLLQMPLAGLTSIAAITVFKRSGVNTNTRIATVLTGLNGSDATAVSPIPHFFNADTLGSHYAGAGPVGFPIADTNFHSAISYLDGAGNGFIRLDASAYNSAPLCLQTADPNVYAALGGTGGGLSLLGEIAAHVRWKTAPTPTNLNNAWIQLRNYYGL
jgi:hypothetical protein